MGYKSSNSNYFQRLKGLISIGLLWSLSTYTQAQTPPKAELIEFWNDSEETSELQINYTQWNAFLKKYVITDHPSRLNRVDYGSVSKEDKEQLDQFLNYMQQMEPRQLNLQRQKAYWINLFNAGVVRQILKSKPKKSIKSLSRNFWKKKRFTIAMQKMSFDHIEHGVLRPIFDDPRIHFSLVDGAIGSANVLPLAFTGENVDLLLEQNTEEFLKHRRGVSQEDGKLELSKIFEWYESDFGGDFNSVKTFIEPYLPESLTPVMIEATEATYQFDWTLNGVNGA